MRDASRGRRAGRVVAWTSGLAWLLAAAALVATGWVLTRHLAVSEARTPSLVGLPIAEADRIVDLAGLELRSYPVEARGLAADVVVEQSPPAGTVVRQGRAISVGVHVPAEADRMPSLVGLRDEDAAATLRDLSLPAPDVRYVASSEAAGRVVQQTPDPGRTVPPGTVVEIVVSRGEAVGRIELPDFRGLDVEAAVTQATALGLRRVETLGVAVQADRPGLVSVQRPGPGAIVLPGEPVTLGYAVDGSSVVRVPDVLGLETWRARVALRRAGLEIGPVETVQDDERPLGVVATRPGGLTVAGALVTLVVNVGSGGDPDQIVGDAFGEAEGASDGPLPGEGPIFGDGTSDASDATADVPELVGGDPGSGRLIPFTFDPQALGVRALVDRPYDLRLVVRDDRGERTVLERRVDAGRTVRTTVVVEGDEPLLQTFVNGVFFQAWRP